MNKLIHSCLIISIITLTPVVHAQDDAPFEVQTEESMQPEMHASPKKQTDDTEEQGEMPALDQDSPETSTVPESYPEEEEEGEGTPVGQAANEGSKTAKRRHLQNIVLATAAVAVAITALVLVANNDGHKSDD